MTKRKWNMILNLGSFGNPLKKGRKLKKPHCNSGEKSDMENEQENVREKTHFSPFTLF
jgi:hypothetical protein